MIYEEIVRDLEIERTIERYSLYFYMSMCVCLYVLSETEKRHREIKRD